MKYKNTKIFLSILLIAIILTGCMPTPKVEIVSHKDDNTISILKDKPATSSEINQEKTTIKVESNKSNEAYIVDKYIAQSQTSNGGLLSIDANVSEHKNSDLNIVELEATTFTEKQVNNVVAYFAGDKPLYSTQSQDYWTKERIESETIKIKQDISQLKNLDDPQNAFQIGELEGNIEELKAMYVNAPSLEEWKKNTLIGDINEVNTTFGEYLLEPENNRLTAININNNLDSNNPMPTLEYNNRDISDEGSAFPRDTDKIPYGLEMSKNDVSVFIEKMLKDLEIEHMGIDSINIAKDFVDTDLDLFERGISREISDVDVNDGAIRYYSVYITRKYNGVNTPYVSEYEFRNNSVVADGEPVDYRSIWGPEYIRVDIDDSGILYFLWSCPTNIVREEKYDGEIISIDEASELFYKNASLLYADFDSKDIEINISDIELGYYYAPIKNDLKGYMMIPCWYFFGTNKNKIFIDDYINDFARAQAIINVNNGKLM